MTFSMATAPGRADGDLQRHQHWRRHPDGHLLRRPAGIRRLRGDRQPKRRSPGSSERRARTAHPTTGTCTFRPRRPASRRARSPLPRITTASLTAPRPLSARTRSPGRRGRDTSSRTPTTPGPARCGRQSPTRTPTPIRRNLPAGFAAPSCSQSALPPIRQSLTITGPGVSVLAVDGAERLSAPLTPACGVTVTLSELTIQNGNASNGFGGAVSCTGRHFDAHRLLPLR